MLPSHQGSFRLFRVAGITVYLHWWWFLFAVFAISTRQRAYSSPVWNVAEYLTLFLIVLLHEFGHSLACRQTGGKADEIVLWPLGGVAFVKPPSRPGAELWSIAAGPLVNVALIPVILGLDWARLHFGWGAGEADYRRYLRYVTLMNYGLLIFNLLPVYPLDGGQILRSLLWFKLGKSRSLRVVTIFGFFGIAAVFALMMWRDRYHLDRIDTWIMPLFLTGFLLSQCMAGYRHAQALLALERAPRVGGFACPACGEAPPGGPLWLCPSCGNRFNPFSTGGVCPHCSVARETVPCPSCSEAHAVSAWTERAKRGSDEPPRLHG
jgi:Zn-dependent protease